MCCRRKVHLFECEHVLGERGAQREPHSSSFLPAKDQRKQDMKMRRKMMRWKLRVEGLRESFDQQVLS